jgi:hypothetical protein
VQLGTMEMMAVPYAFHAQTVEEELTAIRLMNSTFGTVRHGIKPFGCDSTVILPYSGGGDTGALIMSYRSHTCRTGTSAHR